MTNGITNTAHAIVSVLLVWGAWPTTGASSPLFHGGHEPDEAVQPIVECVEQTTTGSLRAHFGYRNENAVPISIPVGHANKLAPGLQDRGQPTQFQPGRSPYYPNAAFSAVLAGANLAWTVKGPDGQVRTATAGANSARCSPPPPPSTSCPLQAFGPQKFSRTCGAPDVYTRTFALPAGAIQPYTLTIKNGEANGSHRVSSARIDLNGAQVLGPSAFGQNIAVIEKVISLAASNTIRVQLQSAPESYLTLSICAASGDVQAPTLGFVGPPTVTKDATPTVVLRYADGQSGVDVSSLRVVVDGTDRSGLFSRRSDEASADLPATIDGIHHVQASLRDLAGNEAQSAMDFTVDTASPTVSIVEPLSGVVLAAARTTIRLAFGDVGGIDAGTLRVLVNSVDRTSAFTHSGGGALAALDLPAGLSQIHASLRDLAGNEGVASASLAVDLESPIVTIVRPQDAAAIGSSEVEVIVRYGDDLGLDPSGLKASLDGQALTLVPGADTALGSAGPLADGRHTLTASIRDRAGHETATAATFTIDTTLPSVEIQYPTAGLVTREIAPLFRAQFSDAQGINPSGVRVRVNGIDRSDEFAITSATASGELIGLLEGENQVGIEARDGLNHVAASTVTFVRDTQPPAALLSEPRPGSTTPQALPSIAIELSDSGSGVAATLTRILVDGSDRTSWFSLTAESAVGVAEEALSEGNHEVRAIVQDHAGNVTVSAAAFAVDTIPPRLEFAQPFPGAFVNTASPVVRLLYSDPQGFAVLDSLRVTLVSGEVETDVTAQLVADSESAAGTLLASLGEGTQRLRAEMRDSAGNLATAVAAFEVDTIAPTTDVTAPASRDYVDSALPHFEVRYSDERSGIELGLVSISIDGIDRTDRFTIGPTGAAGTLAPAESLVDGEHTMQVFAIDRAGNRSRATAHTFFVDTIWPLIVIAQPVSNAYLDRAIVDVRLGTQDASAAGLFASRFFVDGVDRTAQFGVSGGTFVAILNLGDGLHAIRVEAEDWAGHLSAETTAFTVDTVGPALSLAAPADGAVLSQTPVELSGTLSHTDPLAILVSRAGSLMGACIGAFACTQPLAEGPQDVTVTVTDRFGRAATATRSLTLDTRPPSVVVLSPRSGSYQRGPWLDVSGEISDTSAVLVDVNGLPVEFDPPSHAGVSRTFTARLPVVDGPFVIVVTARDAAGNANSQRSDVTIDSEPPAISILSPQDGFVTRGISIPINGAITDASPFHAFLNGTPLELPEGALFSSRLSLNEEGEQTVTVEATDVAENHGTLALSVFVDRTAPVLEIATPDGAVFASLPVVITGAVADATPATVSVNDVPATMVGAAWLASLLDLGEGSQDIKIVATDSAGNRTTLLRRIVVETAGAGPTIVITSPTPGALTRDPSLAVSGTVSGVTPAQVRVNGVSADVTPSGTGMFAFTAPAVDLAEGENHLLAVATDGAGRSSAAEVHVTRDTVPPSIDVDVPETLRVGDQGQALASVTDAVGIAMVRFRLTGPGGCAFEGPTLDESPFAFILVVPECASAGDTLTLEVTATDTAGNEATLTRGIRVTRDGVIVGQVLDDATGLPVKDAQVVLGATAVVTDGNGRYSLPGVSTQGMITAKKEGMTSVDREVVIAGGVGTVPIDVRLTALAAPRDPTEGTLVVGPVSVAATQDSLRLTLLSSQGLPGLLPLGWAPLAAFDWREGPIVASLQVSDLPTGRLHLVAYNGTLRAWTMLDVELEPADGRVSFDLPGSGAFAIVTVDAEVSAVPPAGGVLAGVAMIELPTGATSGGSVVPPALPATGGSALGTLTVTSPVALPSGTVVQAQVDETYRLASGETAGEDTRRQDILIFRKADGTLEGSFPITPSRSYETSELSSGLVHLDILAGRESIRGKAGGSSAVQVEDGAARLSVPSLALMEDTAISVKRLEVLESVAEGITALATVEVDLSGKTLLLGAELSIQLDNQAPGTLVLAQVVRLDGVAQLTVVALATEVGDRVVSTRYPGLPGITTGGRYTLLRLDRPIGFVAGATRSALGPVKAVVSTAEWPFVGVGTAAGRYMVASPSGAVRVVARAPSTSLEATVVVDVTPNETAPLDILLEGAITAAQVTPVNGAQGIALSVPIEIEATAALRKESATNDTVKLFDGAREVPVRLILAGSQRVLAVVPQQALAHGTVYTLRASGLVDQFGGLVEVPETSFRTLDLSAPRYELDALTFSFPDTDGLVSVNAPPGTLPAGTTILIVNSGNGFVATFTTENDGSLGTVVAAQLPASLSDSMLVTVTDPQGNATSFTRSQFEDARSGLTAIGPGGGTVRTADGSGAELRIPQGALPTGTSFKITSFQLEDLPESARNLPAFPEAHFGSGLRIEAERAPSLDTEASLAFALPGGLPEDPGDAFYYVFRRMDGPGGPVFETIDYALVEGAGDAARIVTASPPFAGYESSFGAFTGSFGLVGTITNYLHLMWTYSSQLPGKSPAGAITGRVRRSRWDREGGRETLEPLAGAIVSLGEEAPDGTCRPLAGPSNGQMVAVSQGSGTYTLIDPHYTGGPITLAAVVNGEARCATAYELSLADASADIAVRNLLARHALVATADFAFSALPPVEGPSAIGIEVLKVEGDERLATNGIVTEGTPLVLVLTSSGAGNLTASLQGKPCVAREEGPGQAVVDLTSDPQCSIDGPGTFSVVARGIATFGGVVTASKTFLVAAAGQGNNQTLPDAPPVVVAFAPRSGTRNASTNTSPQVTFSEPVRVAGGVALKKGDQAVAIRLLGVTADGEAVDLAQNAGAAVTALTILPQSDLSYGAQYTIVLGSAIRDLDDPPKALEPTVSSFDTIAPAPGQGTPETFGSPGLALIGDRAYLVDSTVRGGTVKVFDVSDPGAPSLVPQDPEGAVVGRPLDITGESTTVVVATGSTASPKPSNLYIFDVSNPNATRWVGAVSASPSAAAGFVTRLLMRDGQLYAATFKQGIQAIDLARAREAFGDPTPGLQMATALATDGAGWASEAVSAAVPVLTPSGRPAFIKDIKVDDFSVDDVSQPLVVGTGDVPLAVVSLRDEVVYPLVGVETPVGRLTYGEALALGRLGSRQVAVIVGSGLDPSGASTPLLAVVDLSDPLAPTAIGMVKLTDAVGAMTITDVVLNGAVAFVGLQEADITSAQGQVLVVNLGDGTSPVFNATIPGIGGRLAMASGGDVLLGTSRSVYGTQGPLGGLHVATLGQTITLLNAKKKALSRIRLPQNFQTYVSVKVASSAPMIPVQASIIEKDGSARLKEGVVVQKDIPLLRDETTGLYVGPLTIADKDCAIELAHNPQTDEQYIKEPCVADLESGPWTKLRLKLPAQLGGLERIIDIHAFRLVALGDSLTQGVQHAIVVHQHQRYSFPAQMANQINKFLKEEYGQQVVFRQAMIAEPGIGIPGKLGRPYGPGSGLTDELGFPIPARLNPGAQPVNNLALSGARAYHLAHSKEGHWPPYCPDEQSTGIEGAPPFCDTRPGNFTDLRNQQSPVWNSRKPKGVWHFTLGGLDRTAVEQAADLDPSLLILQIGNNDVLTAALDASIDQLTPPAIFQAQYDELVTEAATLTGERANLLVATVPEVQKIPNLRNLGERVGAVAFTANVPLPNHRATRGMENSVIHDRDEAGDCHGITLVEGECERGSAKVPLEKIFATDDFAQLLLTGLGLLTGGTEFRLTSDQVLSPDELATIQGATNTLNDFVLRRAKERGFSVLDVRNLFQERLQRTDDPTRLNSLLVGTPCAVPPSRSDVVRGFGNTLFSWDGVHANSAGYALTANAGLAALKGELLKRSFGGLEPLADEAQVNRLKLVPSGSQAEEDSITWLLFKQYIGLERSRLGCPEGTLTSVE